MRIILVGAALVLMAGCSASDEPRVPEPSTSAPSSPESATEPSGDDPTSGYCAVLVFDSRTYEVADGQQGSGVARPVGNAQGHSCGAKGDIEVAVYTANEQPPEEALTASYGNRVVVYWPVPSAELVPVPYPTNLRHSSGVTAADLALVRAFAQFAVRPTPGYRDAVGFAAQGPRIGLGPALQRTPTSDLAAESAWTFPARGFAGAAGPINILDVPREHLMDTLFSRFTDPSDTVTDLFVSSGDHRRCVGPPLPVPPELAHLRQLSMQPDPETLASCLDWFAVDLYLNRSGRVEAVSLDLLEP